MGFRCAYYNMDRLSEALGVDKNTLYEAMKSSRVGGYARLWTFEDRGTYGTGRISVSSRKDENSPYETQFQDGFVCFSGNAYERAKAMSIPENGVSIVILTCDVRNKYDENTKKMYTNFYVYEFDVPSSTYRAAQPQAKAAKPAAKSTSNAKKAPPTQAPIMDDDDELPF